MVSWQLCLVYEIRLYICFVKSRYTMNHFVYMGQEHFQLNMKYPVLLIMTIFIGDFASWKASKICWKKLNCSHLGWTSKQLEKLVELYYCSGHMIFFSLDFLQLITLFIILLWTQMQRWWLHQVLVKSV